MQFTLNINFIVVDQSSDIMSPYLFLRTCTGLPDSTRVRERGRERGGIALGGLT